MTVMEDFARLEAAARETEAAGTAADAIAAWRKVVSAAPERTEPRRALAHLLRREQRWNELLAALRSELERACPDAEARYAVLMEMADIYLQHLDRSFLAIDAAKRALEVKPDGIEALDALIAIYEKKRSWTDLVALLERRLEQSTGTEARVALLERIAQLSLERFQSSRQAVQVYERVLAEDPGHRGAQEALSKLYPQLGAWEKLILFKKDHVLPGCHGDERLALALELARLAQQKVKRVEVQLDLWRSVREIDPLHPEALEALDPLYRRKQAWSDLAEVIQARIEISADLQARTGLLQKLASLYEERLRDAPGADDRVREIWRDVLFASPSHPRARNALREIYLRRGELDALDDLYADQPAHAYAMVLEQMSRRDQVPMRAALLRRLGHLYRDDLGQAKKAIACFEALDNLAPRDRDTLQTLVELYEEAGEHRKLANALARLLELTDDADGKCTCLQQLAALQEERLSAPSEALRCWLEALTLRPESAYLRVEAERLADLSGEWARLIEAYRQLAEGLAGERRIPLLATIAGAQERHLQQLDAAAASYEAILEIAPSHTDANEGLARVLLAQGRYEALFEHYARKLHPMEEGSGSAATDMGAPDLAARRLAIYREVASLLETQIQQPAEALAMLGRGVREHPGDTETLDCLEALAGRHALWEPLLELYRDVTSKPLPLDAQVELRTRVGRLYEEQLANPARALAAYRRVLDLDPRNAPARQAVVRLQAAG